MSCNELKMIDQSGCSIQCNVEHACTSQSEASASSFSKSDLILPKKWTEKGKALDVRDAPPSAAVPDGAGGQPW